MNKIISIIRKADYSATCVVSGLLVFVLFFAYNFNHGERIQHGDGLGWDGAAYADWAQRDSKEILTSKTISSYYIGRLFPSIAIHNFSNLLGYDIGSTKKVIHAFYIWNFGMILIGIGFLVLIGKYFKWKLPVYVLGFSAVFLNYPILTNFSYNPTLTDVTAYTLSLGIFYFYLKDKFILLLFSSLICSFTWPTMLYGCVLLMFFGRTPIAESRIKIHGHIIALLAALSLLAFAGYQYFVEGLRQTNGTTPINTDLIAVSLILFVVYIYFVLRPLIDFSAYFAAARKIQLLRASTAIFFFLAVKLVTSYFSSGEVGPLSISSYLGLFTQASLSNPSINVVAHAMHFGPFYLVALFLWSKVAELTKEQGIGLSLFVMLFMFLTVGSESRQFINIWPILAILTCEALNRLNHEKISWFFALSMVIISLVLSRYWLTINVGEWTGDFQSFPDQMLYMYTGPWMSYQMYGVFLAITILSSIAVIALIKTQLACNQINLKKGVNFK